MNIIDEAYREAIKVLEHCAKPVGFYASGLPGGYEAVWARDSMIASLGASLAGKKFKTAFAKSLILLSRHQTDLGLIPNAVGSYNIERKSDITFNSIDSNLWYIIGHHVYRRAYADNSLFKKYRKNIEKALLWLKYQDPNADSLIVQQPTGDWQDAFPHKYGRVINTLALYYAALRMEKEMKLANHVRRVINGEIEQYLSLYDKKRGYYLPWIWKSHETDREQEEWFDALGNLLAIVSGLATPQIANSIVRYIERKKINRPYPCKAIYPPIRRKDREWRSYFSLCDAKTSYHYLNAGIWPMIGGFYVAALVKTGQIGKARRELELLAEANRKVGGDAFRQGLKKTDKWGFQEWLHGLSGKPLPHSNPYQAWSAGMYLYAYECVKRKKALFFE